VVVPKSAPVKHLPPAEAYALEPLAPIGSGVRDRPDKRDRRPISIEREVPPNRQSKERSPAWRPVGWRSIRAETPHSIPALRGVELKQSLRDARAQGKKTHVPRPGIG